MGTIHNEDLCISVSVHLLTENRLLRDSLARLLMKKAGMSVAGVSADLRTAIQDITASACTVVLTDCLSTPAGWRMLRQLFERDPQFKVVLFGMEDDPGLFLKAVQLGVTGYVLKEATALEITAAIRTVAQGEVVCPPQLSRSLFNFVAQQARAWPKASEADGYVKPTLTHRQLELVTLVAQGMTNKQIAANLNLSEFTVKNHMRRIMKQVDAEDRYQAVDAVRATGYLPNA